MFLSVIACLPPEQPQNGFEFANPQQNGSIAEFDEVVTYACKNGTQYGPDADLHRTISVTCQDDGNYTGFSLTETNATGIEWPLCEDPLSMF